MASRIHSARNGTCAPPRHPHGSTAAMPTRHPHTTRNTLLATAIVLALAAPWTFAEAQSRPDFSNVIGRVDTVPASAGDTAPTDGKPADVQADLWRSEEHTSELQSLMRISYAVFCLKKKKKQQKKSDNQKRLKGKQVKIINLTENTSEKKKTDIKHKARNSNSDK